MDPARRLVGPLGFASLAIALASAASPAQTLDSANWSYDQDVRVTYEHDDNVNEGIIDQDQIHAQVARLVNDDALVGLELARDQAQERGLARAVRADHTGPAGLEAQVDLGEQGNGIAMGERDASKQNVHERASRRARGPLLGFGDPQADDRGWKL